MLNCRKLISFGTGLSITWPAAIASIYFAERVSKYRGHWAIQLHLACFACDTITFSRSAESAALNAMSPSCPSLPYSKELPVT